MSDAKGVALTVEAALITAKQFARMLSATTRTLRRWLDAGKLPRPVRIGRSLRWRLDEVREWIEAECPGLCEWERMAK
ncbi:MAG: helix-turn-helix domain-containing protein [Planctomycetales bacterium]